MSLEIYPNEQTLIDHVEGEDFVALYDTIMVMSVDVYGSATNTLRSKLGVGSAVAYYEPAELQRAP